MLSTIVLAPKAAFTSNPAAIEPLRLVRTLAALTPLAVEGFLGQVILAAPESEFAADLADEAGCGWAPGENQAQALAKALELARKPWRFVLLAGHAPEPGFSLEAAAAMLAPRGVALRARPDRLHERLFPALAPLAGVLAPGGGFLPDWRGDFAAFARQARCGSALRTPARRLV